MEQTNPNYDMAILGSADAVAGFAAVGVLAHAAETPLDAQKQFVKLVRNQSIAVLFITEDQADALQEDIDLWMSAGKIRKELLDDAQRADIKPSSTALPAIVVIPSHRGSTGAGLNNLRRIVEQAVGSDIIFNK